MQQNITFGNPQWIISDQGAAFTSGNFNTYCEHQYINSTPTRNTDNASSLFYLVLLCE